MKKWRGICLGVVAVVYLKPLCAQEASIDLVVTEGRIIFTPSSAPIYFIPQAEIAKRNPNSLAELLRGLPGFAINDVGFGADIHTGTFYRGHSINQSIYLLNGRPIGTNISTYHGGTDLNSIPVDAIEAVELSSGTAATLYGTEAFGGVVNIITKQKIDPEELNAAVQVGSYAFNRGRLNYGGTSETTNYFVGYERVAADNRYPVPPGAANRGADGLLFNGDTAVENIYGSVGVKLNDRSKITIDGYKTSSRRGLLFFGFPLQRDRLDHDLLNVGVSFDQELAKDSHLFASLGYNQDYFNTYGPTGASSFRIGTLDSQGITSRLEHKWQTNPVYNLTWGLDFQANYLNGLTFSTLPALSPFNEIENRSRTRTALFALNTFKLDNVQLELGLRQTFTNDFGNYFNPTGGIRWQALNNLAFRGSITSGQRNPGLDQLFLFDTVHNWLPNPNLRPETGPSYTAGLDFNLDRDLTAQLTYFGSNLTDRIGIVAGRWENLSRVNTNGLEASLKWQISPQFHSNFSYTYTDAKIAADGLQLSTVPFSVGRLGIGYESGGWQADLSLSYNSGSRRALFNAPGVSPLEFSPAFLNLDLHGKIPLTANVSLNLSLENLADVSYEKVNRIFQPGLTYRVGIQAKF